MPAKIVSSSACAAALLADIVSLETSLAVRAAATSARTESAAGTSPAGLAAVGDSCGWGESPSAPGAQPEASRTAVSAAASSRRIRDLLFGATPGYPRVTTALAERAVASGVSGLAVPDGRLDESSTLALKGTDGRNPAFSPVRSFCVSTNVPLWVWAITLVAILALLAFDFFFHVRQAHEPTLREATIWSAFYVGVAILFGVILLIFGGTTMGVEYFSGYLLEKALSVDNLFVFLVIISSFAVPRADQQKVLLFGIVFALIARSAFIFAGKAMIDNFTWTFYLFGLILIVTAGKLLAPEKEDSEADNFIIRLAKRFLHTTDHYDGDKLFTMENGRRVLTPMLLVMVAIGGTDILFALDSIPAIYAVTTNVYIVFAATAFSLMGLRQLYFLIDGLLDRLVYLKYGLSIILGFIGVKLVLEALHTNALFFINDGEPVNVFTFDAYTSLPVIIGVLTLTVVASLVSPKGKLMAAVRRVDRLAHGYLSHDYQGEPGERTAKYEEMLAAQNALMRFDREKVEAMMEEVGANWSVEKAERAHAEAGDY
ncbi:TerC family protein [Tessaracoccus sp. MC1865]|nr:TerC family protein [Tessaracoccus sp. MC1865]QTO37579.1 TerC family protein [Tessaracoccus sp. MC1865]